MNVTLRYGIATAFVAIVAIAAAADAPPSADARRGALLYEGACDDCHTTQAHWREKRIVKTWPDLLFQVERWQRVAGRGWSAQEIEDVAAYLNMHFYRMPCPSAGCGAPPA